MEVEFITVDWKDVPSWFPIMRELGKLRSDSVWEDGGI